MRTAKSSAVRAPLVRLLVALALMVALAPAATATEGVPQRVYLLGADSGRLYWSVDTADPELQVPSVTRTCGNRAPVRGYDGACSFGSAGAGQYLYTLEFLPASLPPVSPSAPGDVRFHLELGVAGAADYTVHAVVYNAGGLRVSDAATQVAPGAWEGTIAADPLTPHTTLLGIRLVSNAPSLDVTVRLGGASWLERSTAAAARSVPDLIAADTYNPRPMTYASRTRTVRFNDADWQSWRFTGDLRETRTFPVTLDRDAAVVIAWVEVFEAPIINDVAHARQPDRRKLTDLPSLRLLRDTQVVARGTNGGQLGRGEDSLAALDVGAGDLTLRMSPVGAGSAAGTDMPYTVHLIASHGARTLAGMRWTSALDSDYRTPWTSACLQPYQPFPVTADVTTYKVALSWDSVAQPFADWTLGFELPGLGYFPCSGKGRQVRFTTPHPAGVEYVAPVPSSDALHASVQDMTYQLQVDYTYDAAP